MPTNDEKSAFSKRLKLALYRSPEPVRGATELALRFNLRYRGTAISPQTAHKWLTGRAIPTKDKLATLASWLQVDEHWLHYGPSPEKPLKVNEELEVYGASVATTMNSKPTPEALALTAKIQALPPHRRYLVEELVAQLLQDAN
ncbi:MAG TPA: transcriptional regulator [Paucimonas sp.]|nr:transcriptional regulator [Paucimonas sp.]HJW57185.1 transcriptional regulator [Burkholderiaceae bacterium]